MSKIEVSLIKAQVRIRQMAAVCSAILKGEISLYPSFIEKFERRYAAFVGQPYALSFCNGTSAIEAALFAANIGPGDEVIVPACTFHASIDPIVNAGATPIFADVDGKSLTLNPQEVARKLTDRTRAVIAVHLWGIPVDMGALLDVLRGKAIALIEDASHAHGARWGDRACGAWGDFGVFSLQGSKPVAAGEGGITATASWENYLRMSLWGHFNRHAEYFPEIGADAFRAVGLGYKRRMAPLGALLANIDLDYLKRLNQIKQRAVDRLDYELGDLGSIEIVKPSQSAVRGGFYQGYPIRVKREVCSAASAIARLQAAGIQAKPYPFALHHQLPIYTDRAYREGVLRGNRQYLPVHPAPHLPVTEELKEQLLLLAPSYLLNLDQTLLTKLVNVLAAL